jgi:hypothetical protein
VSVKRSDWWDWDFSKTFRFASEMMAPWPALCEWMPVRVNHILDRLALEIPPSDYRFLRIGHRGAAAHAPDNTLLGIRKAAALGADLVEFDVRQTADGQLVLSHDDHLTDAQRRVHLVGQSILTELRAIDLGQDGGINYIDTSPDYGPSEAYIGQAIAHRRSEYYLAAKCGCNIDPAGKGLEPPHVWSRQKLLENIENSLRLLKTDYVDVWQRIT